MSRTMAAVRTCTFFVAAFLVVAIHIYFIWHWVAGYLTWLSSAGTLGAAAASDAARAGREGVKA